MADHLETQATPSSSDSVSTVDFSSDNESLNTTTSTIGNSVFSRLRRARSIRDQAEEVAALTAAGLMHGGWDSVFLYIFLTVPGRINPFRRQEVGITQACKPSQAVILVSRALLNDPSPSQFQGVVLTRLARSERWVSVLLIRRKRRTSTSAQRGLEAWADRAVW
jgi:hypothetical protein